jgi:hypothetical protein
MTSFAFLEAKEGLVLAAAVVGIPVAARIYRYCVRVRWCSGLRLGCIDPGAGAFAGVGGTGSPTRDVPLRESHIQIYHSLAF